MRLYGLAFVLLLTGAAAPLWANSGAICSTPVYDGVCCDSIATEEVWPSGSGCCIGGQPYPGLSCPLLLYNDAQFVSQVGPSVSLTPGQTAAVSVTMRNNGTIPWSDDANGKYRLGLLRNGVPVLSTDPAYMTWGPNSARQSLQAGETVTRQASKTFTFQITAPMQTGTYDYQWQMVQENVQWFGDATPPIRVTVGATTPNPDNYCKGDDIYVNVTTNVPICVESRLQPVNTPACNPIDITESFESYPDGPFQPYGTQEAYFRLRGAVTSQTGWGIYISPWSSAPPATITSVSIKSGTGISGKAVEMTYNLPFGTNNNPAGDRAGIERAIRPTSQGSMQFDLLTQSRTPSIPGSEFVIDFLELDGGYGRMNFYMHRDGSIRYDASSGAMSGRLGTYTIDQWHKIRIDWTLAGYDFFLDGQKRNPKPIPYLRPATGKKIVQVGLWAGSTPFSAYNGGAYRPFYVDNLQYPGCEGECKASSTLVPTFVQSCPFGCKDGACLPEATPTPTPACTASPFTETFESFTSGPLTQTGWTVFQDSGTATKVLENAGNPGKAVELSDSNSQTGSTQGRFVGAAYLIKSIPPTAAGSASFDVLAKQTTGQLAFDVSGPKSDFIYVYLDDKGEFRYWNNAAGGYVGLGKTYTANQWYHVEIRWTGSTFDLFVDGQKINAAPLPYSYASNADEATSVYFYTGGQSVQGNGYAGSFLIDNVQFPRCPLPTPTPFVSPTPSPTPNPLCRTLPRLSKFAGASTTRLDTLLTNPLAELKQVNGFTLETSSGFKAIYRTAVDVCDQDFDANAAFGPGWLSFNHAALHESLVRPTQPVSVILAYPSSIRNPALYYAAGVFSDPAQIRQSGQVCPPSQCRNVVFLNGKAIFDAASFSSYAVDEASATTPTPSPSVQVSVSPSPGVSKANPAESNELKIRCPAGVVAEDNTTVSAFYVPKGIATCVGAGMQVSAFANASYQGVTYVSCDAATGMHRFVINTTAFGTYQVNAKAGSLEAQCQFDAVGRTPTPTPELSEWLILAAALLAFGMVHSHRAKK